MSMDVSWLYLEWKYKYCQFMVLKFRLLQHWKTLSGTAKFFYCLSAMCGASITGWIVYNYFERKEAELKVKLLDDSHNKKLLSNRRKKGLPPGLFNEGNTCFANCVLQALASCSTFSQWTGEVISYTNTTELTIFPSVDNLLRVLTNETGNEDCYSASDVVSSLSAHGWVIPMEQQDAYEFYQILQATMDEEVDKILNSSKIYYDVRESKLKPTILNRVSKNLPKLLNHKLSSPLKGSFANKMTCIVCGYQPPIKFEIFESLTLGLQGVSPFGATLNNCLDKLVKTELVHDVECIKCSARGSKYSSFSKQLSIAKLPQCLCIQLQRTHYSSSGVMIKNSMFVQFDEYINLSTYTYQCMLYKEKQKTQVKLPSHGRLLGGHNAFKDFTKFQLRTGRYKLSSVILHFGEADDGHFVTYRRAPGVEDKWIYTSDELVKVVPKQDVFLCTAYLLFYERSA